MAADTLNALAATSPTAERALFGVPTHTAIGDVATGANVATFTAKVDMQWCLCEATVSFGATTTAATAFTVSDGATVIYKVSLPTITNPGPFQIIWQRPLHGTTNTALTLNLATPGSIASTISGSAFPIMKP